MTTLAGYEAANFSKRQRRNGLRSTFRHCPKAPAKRTPRYAFGHLRVHGWMSGGGEHLKDEVSKHS